MKGTALVGGNGSMAPMACVADRPLSFSMVSQRSRRISASLPPDPLHRATAVTEQRRYLQYAVPGAQMPSDSVLHLRRQAAKPLALLAHTLKAGDDSASSIDLSCSPDIDAIWIIARPIGV